MSTHSLTNYLFGSVKILSFCCFLTVQLVYGQDFAIPLGNAVDNEGGASLVRGPSGDYFIAGYSNNEGMLCRVSPTGGLIWSKSIDAGPDPDYILHVNITTDNYLVGCGTARTVAVDNPYGFVFKMDLSGSLVWGRRFICDNEYMWANGFTEASNGNYRVTGSYKNTRLDNYVVEFDDATGVQVWDTIYARNNIDNTWDESFYDIVTHNSNNANYIGGRFQKAGGNTTYRPSLTKINPDGSLAWSKTYLYNDSPAGGRYYCFDVDQDGDSLIMGLFCKDGGGTAPFQTGIIKTDLDGNIGWAKLYVSPGNDLRTYNMVNTPDGYLISGWIQSGDKSLYMIKTDKAGTVVWAKYYGGGGDEDTYLASSNSRVIVDGAYAVTVGRTNSFGGSDDVFLVKADLATGELDDGTCYDDLIIVESFLPNFQADYPMVTEHLPITSEDPAMPVDELIFEGTGELLDEIADTVVGGDTIRLCNGDMVTLFADWSPSFDFLWNTGGTDQSETVSESGTYYVDVSSEDGCYIWSDTAHVLVDTLLVDLGPDTSICDMTTYLLDAGPLDDGTYLWNDGSTDQTLLADADGWYWVTIENDICSFTDSIEITFASLILDLGPDSSICADESVLLDAANPGATYEWIDGSTDQTLSVNTTGDYWVIVTEGDCVVKDTVTITVSDIDVDLVDDLTLCTGESILLDAGPIAGTYLWNDGSTGQTLLVTSDGTYTVVVTDGICTATDEITVTFFEPVADFEGDPLTGCAPLTVDFTDLSTTPSGMINSWFWSFGDGGTSTLENPIHTYTVPGVYDVSLTIGTDLGCSDNAIITDYIVVSENVTTNFTYSPDYITSEDIVSFTNLSTNATSWFWDFGDGNTSTAEHPEHQFSGTGEFTITLTAMNDEGCNETITHTLIVKDAVYIFIPNVFTPDGDDFNEIWKPSIYGIDIYDFHLALYNRWGEIIWESFDPSAGWNGAYGGGDLVQDGVYVWIMEYGDRWTDEQYELKGHVTVLK